MVTASTWAQYAPGFAWNRYDDWKCGKSDECSAGNPCKDSAGNAVWSAEYILNVPCDSGLDTDHPWFLLPSSGLMVWDGHWSGGTWARLYDRPPTTLRVALGHIPTDQSYGGDHYAAVPLLRWRNPSAVPLRVSLTSGSDFRGQLDIGMPTGTIADIVIVRTDASDGNSMRVLYRQTIVKTLARNLRELQALPALAIDNLVLDPGDDILFSIRSRTRTTGFTWSDVAFHDDVTITVKSSGQPERRGPRRLADRRRDAGFTWNRWKDWMPGTTDGKSAGNPCADSTGKGVWSYEYIAKVPCDSGLDSESPWYKLPSSGLMVWDGHTGPAGAWGYRYDNAPFVFPGSAGIGHVPNNDSYRGDHFAVVPLVRWKNPSSVPIRVSLTSGPGFQGRIHYWPPGTTVDLVIAKTDASDGGSVHLLYSQTIVKTLAQGQHEYFALPALNVESLRLDPGDDILFSVRARNATTGFTWYSAMFNDDVNITVLPDRQCEAGFTWNRCKDWQPGKSDECSAGNPGKDSAGKAVWSAEYILNVPCNSGLDTDHPWFLLPSSGLMVWDGHWSGGTWARLYDYPPTAQAPGMGHVPNNDSYHGNHYANVPLVRWKNPSGKPMRVSLTSGSGFLCKLDIGMPTGTVADVVIARTDASDDNSVHVLYRQTVVKTRATSLREMQALPALAIDDLVLDPGDDILFSIRSRTRITGFTWFGVAFHDDVDITVLP
jgi:hypothetical protein